MRSAFTNLYPEAGLYRFEWTGVNGADHRLKAAQKLAVEIGLLQHTFPDSMISVVAHSHGGNVLAWASTRLEKPLSHAIYLNTPFIQVLPQWYPSHSLLRYVLGFLAFLVMGIGGLPFAVLDYVPAPIRSACSPLATALAIATWWFAIRGYRRGRDRINNIRNEAEAFHGRIRKIQKELVVFVVGDEASGALNSVYFAHFLWPKLIAMLFISLGLTLVGVVALNWSYEIYQRVVSIWLALLLGTVVVLTFFSVSGYGIVLGLISLDSEVAVTPAPVGTVDCITVNWTLDWRERDKLRHSLIYDSEKAISQVMEWLTSQTEPRELRDAG